MKYINLIVFIWVQCIGITFCFPQTADKSKKPIMLGISSTPNYDQIALINLSYYLPFSSLKEFQVLFSLDMNKNVQYYRAETGVNWFITKNNKLRKLQIFPSTSICYAFRQLDYEYFKYTYKAHESFMSLGFNTNYAFHKNIMISGRAQLGYGGLWEYFNYAPDAPYLPGSVATYVGTDRNNHENSAALNMFYYIGLRVHLNRK